MNKESQEAQTEAKIKALILGMLDGKTLKCRPSDSRPWVKAYAQVSVEKAIKSLQEGFSDGVEYRLFSPKQKFWQWIGKDHDGSYYLTLTKFSADPWQGLMVTAEPYLPSEEERDVE